jgi:hypothetical protein
MLCWATNFNSVYDSISVFLLLRRQDICFHDDYQQGFKVNLVNDEFLLPFSLDILSSFSKQSATTSSASSCDFRYRMQLNTIPESIVGGAWHGVIITIAKQDQVQIRRYRFGFQWGKRFGSLLIETK